jgi:NAD+-dependent protein deacetylase sirtuin 6
MADTALDKDEIKEFHDTVEKIAKDAKELASLLKSSKHALIFTGAGISTSAGIADFRGPEGVWTLRAQGKRAISKRHVKMPTKAHMAFKKLIDEGLVKHLISQNTDALHVKSGIPFDKISELHGNTNMEFCKTCGRKFYRNYRTRTATQVHNHETGRKCECGGKLYDTIINFGENLPDDALESATKASRICDCSIIIGTSLRVTPACEFPFKNKSNRNIAIINLQKTPYDNEARIVCHAKADYFMELVMKELNLEIPDFIIEFDFDVKLSNSLKQVKVICSSIKLVEFFNGIKLIDVKGIESDINLESGDGKIKNFIDGDEITLRLNFNLLNPFNAIVKTKQSAKFSIKLNTFKNTITYTAA